MSSNKQLTVAIALIVSVVSLSVYAQSAKPKLNHFSTDGISFDYPAGYSVSDESTTEAQQFVITRRGSLVQLTIVALRRFVPPGEMPAATEDLTEPMLREVSLTLGRANSPRRLPIYSSVGSKEAEGVRLRSSGVRKRTAEVIWLRLNSRLVAMSFVRSDVHEAVEYQLWQIVRASLKVDAPVMGVAVDRGAQSDNATKGGTLNGKALSLPKPEYPELARAAHASGTVVVRVLIDEEGNVIEATAVSGHPLLQAASVAAAREAKFTPLRLSGQPVKLSGEIHYNFVSQE